MTLCGHLTLMRLRCLYHGDGSSCPSQTTKWSSKPIGGGWDGKESACIVGDRDSIPGLERSPGEGSGYPLQYSCLGNSWTEEPGELESLGSQRVRHNWATNTVTSSLEGFFFTFEKYNTNGYVCSPSLCLLPQPHSMRFLDSWSTSTADTTLGK